MNLAHIIDEHPAEAAAIVAAGRVTTYGELRHGVDRLRAGLVRSGVTRGDRVALVMSNGHAFAEAYLAVLGAGAVAVPLNPLSPALELQHQLGLTAPRAAIVDSAGWANFRDVSTEVPLVLTVDVPGQRSVAEFVGAAGDPARLDRAGADLGAEVDASPSDIVDVDEHTVAVAMFTSGTAGAPIPACLTHANLLANIRQAQQVNGSLRSDDVIFGVIPLSHIFGLNVVLGAGLYAGASVVLVQRFDPFTALQSITEREVTVVVGAPPMWVAFSQLDELPDDVPPNPFQRVRLALTGAARMPEAATRRLHERFGIELREGYGLTEASPVVTSSVGQPWRPGSVGRPLPGVEVRLVDNESAQHPLADVEPGDTGEVWVRGDNVFAGYLDAPEATARALTGDGWLRTGDIGMFGEDGCLYLVDRAKDLIIVSGFNVFPAEVEDVIGAHPSVAEVAVVGVPHPHTGEAVKAFVVPRADDPAGAVDEEAIIAWCAERLARYKCPSKVLFVSELPRSVAGKVLRRSLDR